MKAAVLTVSSCGNSYHSWCQECALNPVYMIQPVVSWQPAVSCKQTSNRLSYRFDNSVERTATVRSNGCQTGLYNRFDNRRLSNRLPNGFDDRFDNRLYRVNGALVLTYQSTTSAQRKLCNGSPTCVCVCVCVCVYMCWNTVLQSRDSSCYVIANAVSVINEYLSCCFVWIKSIRNCVPSRHKCVWNTSFLSCFVWHPSPPLSWCRMSRSIYNLTVLNPALAAVIWYCISHSFDFFELIIPRPIFDLHNLLVFYVFWY